MTRNEQLQQVKDAVDALMVNDDVPIPFEIGMTDWARFGGEMEDVKALKAVTGSIAKKDADHISAIGYTGVLPGGRTLTIYVSKTKTCVKKVVGTKMVSRPDPDAPLIEVEEDIIEWECEPILGK